MVRWVSREEYESQQSVNQAAGLLGIVFLLIGSLFWMFFQGVKRPLAFSIYLAILVAVLIPVSSFMSSTDNGLLVFVLALVMIGVLIGAFAGAKGPILYFEMLEARLMVWTYNKSPVLGMSVYWLLMAVTAVIGAGIVYMIGQFVNQLFDLALSPWIYYAIGFVASPLARVMSHPLSGQVDILGRPLEDAPSEDIAPNSGNSEL
ncbi:hypothetical protein [Pseudovibrio exalbescens]|uniref:Uncharacterized protein n=1 Tax=Pseudovibrio exalbescens TaxID=197461 RepID=A0A1U7JDT7_9HYPH|nr:hypothetical protein [Pseudovibrio exalbescens]OKL42854.1 hypothetical protein A3843_16950 [Pseudovibrio exalbescens]